MPIPRKGTPEYEAWKNSPMYEKYVQRCSSVSKRNWDNPEQRQDMVEKRHREGRNEKKSVDFFSRVDKNGTNGCWIWTGRKDKSGQCYYDTRGRVVVARRWSYEYHNGPIPDNTLLACLCENPRCVNPDHLGIAGKDFHRKFTDESKAKIAEANRLRAKGTPEGDAWRERVAQSACRIPGTPEYEAKRKKCSVTQKGRKLSPEHVRNLAIAREGLTFSEEAKANLSVVRKKRWENLSEEEKNAQVERLRNTKQKYSNTWIERYYAQQLDTQGIAYERQKRIGWYRVDFYIESERRIVELNGCFWHCCERCGYADAHPGKREKEAKRYEYLQSKGYTVEIIWEHDLPGNPRHTLE